MARQYSTTPLSSVREVCARVVLVRLAMGLLAVAITVLSYRDGLAEDVEYDVCSCKQVQIGAQSSLRGGVCQRTEDGTSCLMQWGARSRQKVPTGNGQSQEEASIKAEDLIKRGIAADFIVTPLISPTPGNLSPMQIAIANLSRMPPNTYTNYAIPESFVLVAASALARFDVPIELLAKSLLGEQRNQLVAAVQKEGTFKVDRFDVKGREGCLQIDVERIKLHVYIKTPFAASDKC